MLKRTVVAMFWCVGLVGCGARSIGEQDAPSRVPADASGVAAPNADARPDGVTDGGPDHVTDGGPDHVTDGGPARTTLQCSNPGLQAGAPWPMKGACQSHTARSPFVGPAAARVRWTWAPESGSCGDAPVVIDAAGTIYVAPGSQLYAVAPDGRTKWSYPVQTSQTAPVIGADGTIYYAGSDNFVALTRDGLERFASGAASAWQNFYGSPAIGADSTLYFTNIEHELVAVSGAGAKQWSLTDNTITHSSPAIGEDGTLYTSTSSHSLLAVGRDGALRWQAVGHGGTMGEPVVRADGTVYMVDASRLVAYRPDGHEAWHFDGATSGGTPALGIDGTVYLGADTGSAGSYKFCAVRADGTLAWSFDTDGIFTAQPAIGGDGTIYAGSRGGTLYAWRTDGTLAWSYAVGTPMIHTAPAIGEDGTLYLCADKLYAFDP